MSTFYLVLYIFIAIIVLLCVVSICMYLMHICGGRLTGETPRQHRSKSNAWWLPAVGQVPEDQQPLNQVTNISGHEQVELVHVRKPPQGQEHYPPQQYDPRYHPQPQAQLPHSEPTSLQRPQHQYPPQPLAHQHPPQSLLHQHPAQLLGHQQQKVPQIQQHGHHVQGPPYLTSTTPQIHDTVPPDNYPPVQEPPVLETKHVEHTVSKPRQPPAVQAKPARPLSADFEKPSIPVKPLVHSVPASKRNSLVRPSDPPPPPPPNDGIIVTPKEPQVTHSTHATVVKPKVPPPPPPVKDDEDLPAPPEYSDVIYDKPETGNYFSDY